MSNWKSHLHNDWTNQSLKSRTLGMVIRWRGELDEDGVYAVQIQTDDNDGSRSIKRKLERAALQPEPEAEIEHNERDYGDPNNTLPTRFYVKRWDYGVCKRCMKDLGKPGVVVRIRGVGWWHDDCFRIVMPDFYVGL